MRMKPGRRARSTPWTPRARPVRTPISLEVVEAYVQCPRKAFLLLRGGQEAAPHEYQRILEEHEAANREAHRSRPAADQGGVPSRGPDDLAAGHKVLLD